MTKTCVEPGLLLTLKFPSPPFDITPTQTAFADPKNAAGSWDFLQALTAAAAKNSCEQAEAVYVHPLVKRSESMLSEKSLEMCTESLFSETGSDDTSVELPSLQEAYPARGLQRRRRGGRSSGELPPPLPSISGGGGVQVKAVREGGRLVMEAVEVSPAHACFIAERSEGRLRLSFSDECAGSCSNHMEDVEEEDRVEEEEEEEEEGKSSGKVESYGRNMSRCNEEGKMMNNNITQGAYWVATS